MGVGDAAVTGVLVLVAFGVLVAAGGGVLVAVGTGVLVAAGEGDTVGATVGGGAGVDPPPTVRGSYAVSTVRLGEKAFATRSHGTSLKF